MGDPADEDAGQHMLIRRELNDGRFITEDVVTTGERNYNFVTLFSYQARVRVARRTAGALSARARHAG